MREDDDLKRATELSLQGMDQICLHVEQLAVETHEIRTLTQKQTLDWLLLSIFG